MSKRQSSPPRSRGGKTKKSIMPIMLLLVGLVAIGGVVWWILNSNDEYKFSRAHLDEYVKITQEANLLGDGGAVYIDMSNGMNYAYANDQDKRILRSVVDKFAANSGIRFYGLADNKITPIDKSHTELYNYLLNAANYNLQKAPIEETLKTIVEKNQPALLMTDFEEYNNGVIHQSAYAKKYFIDWLNKGYNITFYKWAFQESGKQKNMFITVFDDNAYRLRALVDNAVKEVSPNIDSYVLGGKDFAFPIMTNYISEFQGGNYHDKNGNDIITAVVADKGPEAYVSYSQPVATSTGKGAYDSLDNLYGAMAEYYPLGVNWADAVKNVELMKQNAEADIDFAKKSGFEHLFGHLFVNFGAQHGYKVEEIEVRVFDVHEVMKKVAESMQNTVKDNANLKAQLDTLGKSSPEAVAVLVAAMKNSQDGVSEIFMDFHDKFNGTAFVGGIDPNHLLRANIVISKLSPDTAKAMSFFKWDGNESLAQSVIMTLNEPSCIPDGRIIYTYYLKTL